MKKNKTMRLASLLLVLVLLSTCVISGTFAKYVTKNSAGDSARVAKWGVLLSMDAGTFATEYVTDDSTHTDQAKTVVSVDKVVAPGTDSDETDCTAVFGISGSPEVVVKADVDLSNIKEVFLKAGNYIDYTEANEDGTYTKSFELSSDYYPVVWTLTQTKYDTFAMEPVTGTLKDIKAALDLYNGSKDASSYAANQDIDAEFELSWAWSYGEFGEYNSTKGTTVNDKADTFLGMIAANPDLAKTSGGTALTVDTDYSLNTSYTLTVTATQVD